MMKLMSEKVKQIEDYLDCLFPNPQCELIYHSDWELLLAVVLSAQTTDKRVNGVTPILFTKYPTLKALKDAEIKDLERILRPIGSFRKKAQYVKEIATIIETKYHGKMPQTREELEALPGVGRKTVNVVLSELYQYPAIAVDTHVERISKRLSLANFDDTPLDVEKKLMRKFEKNSWGKRHLQLVLFGRYYCKAVKPMCENCSLQAICREQKVKYKKVKSK